MKVCIIGGGNIGSLLTAELSNRGIDTYLYTKTKKQWSDSLDVFDYHEKLLFSSNRFTVTDCLDIAVQDSEYVWVTYPAFLFAQLSEQLLPIMKKGQTIVCVPGSGGAEFAFSSLIRKGISLCGLQRVHCISRIKEKGKSVYALGRKDLVQLGSIPSEKSKKLSNDIARMLSMKCISLPNYLCVTLTPSNPILHTSRLYSMFKSYSNDVFYDHNFLFYEEWTDESSELLLACDNELQLLCNSIKELDLSSVVSLKKHYGCDGKEALTKKITHIEAFKGILSPMKKTVNGWVPDFRSRYFKADFSFGLKVIIEIAEIIGCSVPSMKRIWDWYVALVPCEDKNSFSLLSDKWNIIFHYYMN